MISSPESDAKNLNGLQMKNAANITLALALTVFATGANAISLAPVYLVVPTKSTAAVLQIDNTDGDDAMVFDVRVMSWAGVAADGGNVLAPTDAVISSRPVITVPAHKKATVRLLATTRTGNAQDNYRVLLKDISPNKPGDMAPHMTTSLPLIVVNDMTAKAKLEVADGKVTNVGGRHARITSFRGMDGKTVSTLRYILPGQSAAMGVASVADINFNDSLY